MRKYTKPEVRKEFYSIHDNLCKSIDALSKQDPVSDDGVIDFVPGTIEVN